MTDKSTVNRALIIPGNRARIRSGATKYDDQQRAVTVIKPHWFNVKDVSEGKVYWVGDAIIHWCAIEDIDDVSEGSSINSASTGQIKHPTVDRSLIVPGARVRLARDTIKHDHLQRESKVSKPHWVNVTRVLDGRIYWVGDKLALHSCAIEDIDDVIE